MSDALVIENLNKQQGDFSIKDFELVLPAKCVMGLAGDTGAGKSTIVKMIMGLEKPDSGTIKVFGHADAKYLLVSYNSEGYISFGEMETMLSAFGEVDCKKIKYNTFRGSRNLGDRDIYVTEYIFTVKKR